MNTVKLYPEYGDIFFIDKDGNKRFVGQDATTEFVNSIDAVGVVYDVNGRTFSVVAGVNDQAFPASIACDYEITSIPTESGDYEVTLQGAVVGNFTYTNTNGTKSEFVSQLNTWLETNAPKWEAYMEDDNTAILQMSTYDTYEGTVSISGCTLSKRVLSELEATTNSKIRNQVGQTAAYSGCCRVRLGEWVPTQTSPNNNPTTRMNGTTQLFVNYPCSEAYYNGELGDGLRENFATYEDYLDACMCRPREVKNGIMQYTDGKQLSDLLLNKKLLVRGIEKNAYPCAIWANNFDCGVDGYGAGIFHQASMSELAILMLNITLGTKQPLDAVNTSLSKRTGWSQISSTSNRWAAGCSNTSFSWSYSSYGICGYNYFFDRRFLVSAVAHFTLD